MNSNNYNEAMLRLASVMRLTVSPAISINLQMSGTIAALQELANTYRKFTQEISPQIQASINAITEAFSPLSASLDAPFIRSLEQISTQLTEISKLYAKLYDIKHVEFFSDEASDFLDTSQSILSDWTELDLPEEIHAEIAQIANDIKPSILTPDRILTLVAILIAVFSLIHDFLSDGDIERTNLKLQQLIELQNHQIELLESKESVPE